MGNDAIRLEVICSLGCDGVMMAGLPIVWYGTSYTRSPEEDVKKRSHSRANQLNYHVLKTSKIFLLNELPK